MPLGSFRMSGGLGRRRPIAAAAVAATGGTISIFDTGTQKYAVHTFTTTGTFAVTSGGSVDALLVGAGGGSGALSSASSYASGGGGAGQVINNTITVAAENYSIVPGTGVGGGSGNPTTAFGLTAAGGGRGAGTDGVATTGSSGGGGGANTNPTGANGTTGQGTAGGNGYYVFPAFAGGGGGGSATAGQNGQPGGTNSYGLGGRGGDGYNATGFHTSETTYFAAGGSGGGRGGRDTTQLGANTLGSGAVGQFNDGSARGNVTGFNGIAIIRYPISSVRISDSVFVANPLNNVTPSVTTGKFSSGLAYTYNTSRTIRQSQSRYEIGSGQTFNAANTPAMTLEFWWKISDNSRDWKVFSTNNSFGYNSSAANTGIEISRNNSQSSVNVRLGSTNIGGSLSITNNTWYHFAVQSTGTGSYNVWHNGSPLGSTTSSSHTFSTFGLGMGVSFGSSEPLSGNTSTFDEVRISYGTRYTPGQSFTPATAAFANDTDTLGLFHCESATQTDDKS